MLKNLSDETKIRMEKTIISLRDEFTHIRTGRASSTLVDRIKISYYGTLTPLKQIANISIPESNLIVIQPWDKNCLSEIEKAIWKSDLGLTPSIDGNVIRLIVPPLNEERRKELVRLVKKEAENGKISIRNIRREVNDSVKKEEKESNISEDDSKKYQNEVQILTDEYIKSIDKLLEIKEKEIMEV
ncbi:MAG TPA: ribosome recycling factor [Candidatus Atribacteria bacterium]|nr:ribosome recycling factor [Candidatus Atribacteria bacterium]